jgi:hypothetical protein
MDGGWVLAAVGAVGGVVLLLERALDAVTGLAQRMVPAIHALRTVRSAWKGTQVDDDENDKSS